MNQLLDSLLTTIGNLLGAYGHWLVIALIAVIVLSITLALLVHLSARWREADGWRKPLKVMPRNLHKAKTKILANAVFREMYAPANQYIEDLAEGERVKWSPAWITSHPAAIRATIKKNKSVARGKKLKAAQQIAETARWIRVTELPEFVGEMGSPKAHYWVELGRNGEKTDEELKSLAGKLKNTLGAKSVDFYPTESDSICFIVHLEKAENPLEKLKPGIEFFTENAAKTWNLLPLAVNALGEAWSLAIHHTLIYGTTGSGKGSPLHAIIRQLAKFASKRLVKFYGIDPKGTELDAYVAPPAGTYTPIFDRVSIGVEEDDLREHAKTIAMVKAELSRRMKEKKVDFTPGQVDLGRSFTPSTKNPMIVFLIDEFFSLRTSLQTTLKGESKQALSDLDVILAMGRSFGIFVIAATQFADQESLGKIRDNIPNRLCLRHVSTDHYTTLMLGDDAIERGYNPRAIGPANAANGYRTSGIGIALDASGDLEWIRFAYSSDEDVADLVMSFRREGDPEPQTNALPAGAAEPQREQSNASNEFDDYAGYEDYESE